MSRTELEIEPESLSRFAMPYPALEYVSVTALRPYDRNARTHSRKQIKQIAASIREFGFLNPVLVDDANMVLAGHGRLEAAKLEGFTGVPVIRFDHLTEVLSTGERFQRGERIHVSPPRTV